MRFLDLDRINVRFDMFCLRLSKIENEKTISQIDVVKSVTKMVTGCLSMTKVAIFVV